jgi:hypothetical protein
MLFLYKCCGTNSQQGPGEPVNTVTKLLTGWPGFDSWYGRIFIFATTSILAAGPHLDFYPVDTKVLSSGVIQPGREAIHPLPSTAEVKNAWSYTSTSPYDCMTWCLIIGANLLSPVTTAVLSNFISPYHNTSTYLLPGLETTTSARPAMLHQFSTALKNTSTPLFTNRRNNAYRYIYII